VQTLSELADPQTPICYGIVQVKQFVDSGVPTLAIRDLEGDYRTNVHHTAPAIEAQYTRSRVQPDDLLISIKGTTGRVDVVPETFRGNISRDLARIRFRDGVFPHFFKFYFQSPFGARTLDLVTVGTTRKEISIAPLKQVSVPVPPKDEQRLIAGVLRTHISVEEAEEARLRKLVRLKTGLMQDLLTGKVSVEPLLQTENAR
jgi:type I restriction enzyme S subunit